MSKLFLWGENEEKHVKKKKKNLEEFFNLLILQRKIWCVLN